MSGQPLTVTFVGAGRYSDVFKVSGGNRRSVIMKLSYYRDSTLSDFVQKLRDGDEEAARRAKNRDSIMVSAAFAKATNAMVTDRVSPHFVFVYCHADCRDMVARLQALLPDRLSSSTPVQRRYNNAAFMEVFSTDMTHWLRSRSATVGDDAVRAAVFGIVYTLAALQHRYPGFRHNDLSTNNVLVKKLRRPFSATYTAGNAANAFHVHADVLVAVSDYDFTHAPTQPKLFNERVMGGRYKVTATPNPTYDTHFFIKSVLKCLAPRLAGLPETRDFLHGLPLRAEDRLDAERVPGLEPEVLLQHRYFAPLRRPTPTEASYGYGF
jgi:hypothetical protein